MKAASMMMTLFALLFFGCTDESVDEHSHGTNGLEALTYTLYSDKTELFVEFKPLIVGEISDFAAHFTVLGAHFSPLENGKVTVSLITGQKGIRNSTDTVSAPGIFRLALKPTVAGTGKLIFDIETKDYTDQIVIENVNVYPDEHAALERQHEHEKEDEITYLKEQAWKVEFANTPVERKLFNNIIKTNGEIIAAPGDEMRVTANTSGSVIFMGNKAIVGSKVNNGSHLFAISGGNISIGTVEATYKKAKANYNKAKSEFERASKLVKDNIVTQKEYLQAKTDYENAQTNFKMVAKNYSAKGQAIQAPISGYVKDVLVHEGQFVEAGEPLAIISKNKTLLLQAHLSQRYFDQLPQIESANFKISGIDSVFSTEELNGKVVAFGKSTTSKSPFIPITFEINNEGKIIPGAIVEVYLKSSPISNALVIPTAALMEEQGKFYVYVQTGGESFEKRAVKLGATDGLEVQVLSGVSEGERVVTKGAYQIKLSTASDELPAHGHEH